MAAAKEPGLWDELKEAYETYEHVSFTRNPPKEPFGAHWQAVGERASRIFLGMPAVPVLLLRIRDYFVRHDVAVLPYVCEVLSIAVWRVSIGRHVTIGPGLIIPHGQVVIDGRVSIGRNCSINPWVTIGLSGSRRYGFDRGGPTIGDDVYIGTGVKIIGPVTIGDGVRIGANAVVIEDVPAGATVVGVPARVVHEQQETWPHALKPAGG
jgi:serine O-acetyltransferase